jgi:hypothetical protein
VLDNSPVLLDSRNTQRPKKNSTKKTARPLKDLAETQA